MDRKIYKRAFTIKHLPEWTCPTCQKGVLQQVKGAFYNEESTLSKDAHGHEAWEPEWITFNYSNTLKCSNSHCGEIVINVGEGFVDWDVIQGENGYPEQVYTEYFRPKYFQPYLKLFIITDNIPDEVRDEIEQSFSLFFSNPDSSLNHIRISLENLLTYLKVKKYTNRDGKRFPISLHKRIDLVPNKHDHIKDLFLAVKWLGNAGSHSSKKVSKDDVMDAYEIMDAILSELFQNKKEYAKKLSKQINKKKGPK